MEGPALHKVVCVGLIRIRKEKKREKAKVFQEEKLKYKSNATCDNNRVALGNKKNPRNINNLRSSFPFSNLTWQSMQNRSLLMIG